jgi:hypothetical protein
MPAGKPPKYREEYCELVIDHMAKGHSFDSFGGAVGVCNQTLYNWASKYPEFEQAKREGFAKAQLFWEKIGIAGVVGKVPGFNVTGWIFNMKNRFKWHDRQEIQHELGEGTKQILLDAAKAKEIISADPIDVKVIDVTSEEM